MTSNDPAAALASLPAVGAAIDEARTACEELRWHPAMRRRSAQVRAEALVWQAWASAALEGAKLPVEQIRAIGVGALTLDDPLGRAATGAVRAAAEADRLAERGGAPLSSAPAQALARLHLAAVGGLAEPEQIGRTSSTATERRDAVLALLKTTTRAPALVIAAIAHAEIVDGELFPAAGPVVARALGRAVVVGRGLDPMGSAVPEVYWWEHELAHRDALAGYHAGGADGVGAWLVHYAHSVAEGALFGKRLADSVITGEPIRA